MRPLRSCSWLPTEWAGPIEGYTLRECYVVFLLSGLPKPLRKLLLDWLIDPTDLRRWPPPSSFASRRVPLAESDLRGKSLDDYRDLLREELKVIRQTLDTPPEVLNGLTRYGLLVAHGMRLRQLALAMQPNHAERELQQMIA